MHLGRAHLTSILRGPPMEKLLKNAAKLTQLWKTKTMNAIFVLSFSWYVISGVGEIFWLEGATRLPKFPANFSKKKISVRNFQKITSRARFFGGIWWSLISKGEIIIFAIWKITSHGNFWLRFSKNNFPVQFCGGIIFSFHGITNFETSKVKFR